MSVISASGNPTIASTKPRLVPAQTSGRSHRSEPLQGRFRLTYTDAKPSQGGVALCSMLSFGTLASQCGS
jgi:hypothetical protein